MFAKNGNDVTTLALTVARAQTGKKAVLVQPQGRDFLFKKEITLLSRQP